MPAQRRLTRKARAPKSAKGLNPFLQKKPALGKPVLAAVSALQPFRQEAARKWRGGRGASGAQKRTGPRTRSCRKQKNRHPALWEGPALKTCFGGASAPQPGRLMATGKRFSDSPAASDIRGALEPHAVRSLVGAPKRVLSSDAGIRQRLPKNDSLKIAISRTGAGPERFPARSARLFKRSRGPLAPGFFSRLLLSQWGRLPQPNGSGPIIMMGSPARGLSPPPQRVWKGGGGVMGPLHQKRMFRPMEPVMPRLFPV